MTQIVKYSPGLDINRTVEESGVLIVDGMPNDVYHAQLSISSSGLRTILKECPQKYWFNSPHNPNKPKREQDTKFNIGNAAHDYLLQREEFFLFNYVLPDDFNPYTKAGKELKAAKIEEGFNVIKHGEFQAVKGMVKAIDEHPFASAAFMDGVTERSLFWKDEETGIMCRCRPDFLPNDFLNIPDYKTTVNASPEGVSKSMANFGYHMQHAWYMEGIQKVTGVTPKGFFFVFQEKEAPYIVTCAMPDADAIHYGKKLNRKALRMYAECLSSDTWPGYSDSVIVAELPTWELMRLDQEEQDGNL